MQWFYQFGTGLVVVAVIAGVYVNWNKEVTSSPLEKPARYGEPFWGTAKMQGRRNYMEDTSSHLIDPSIQLFGVYDGHANDRVSLYLEEYLLQEILTQIQKGTEDTPASNQSQVVHNSLMNAFQVTNENYKAFSSSKWKDWDSGGSTAVVGVLYQHDDGSIHLSVANTGDSRGIFCCKHEENEVYPMSYDHKPNSPSEKARIEASGGFIAKAARGPWRVNGILATSRSFGDFSLSPQVIADPEIIDIEIGRITKGQEGQVEWELNPTWSKDGANLILASDGFWDVFSNQEAGSYVQILRAEGKSPEEIAEKLVSSAYERMSYDNITLLVVFVDQLLLSMAR